MRPPENIDVNLRVELEKKFKHTGHKSVDRIQQILNSCLKDLGISRVDEGKSTPYI
jgi:hypothetical protein